MSEQSRTALYHQHRVEEFISQKEPFYLPVKDEVQLFEAAYSQKLPVLLKGPTGCGKTRFLQYMAYRLGKPKAAPGGSEHAPSSEGRQAIPLVTVACHEDLTASDLVGRYLLEGDSTVWIDGPLTRAVKAGAICYLDEIVEARKDTTVLIHPLTDHRRILPMEKKGEVIEAGDDFLMVISFNPGYQSALKEIKLSTRQRFVAIEFGYPPLELETNIIKHECGISESVAWDLARLGDKVRNLKEYHLQEGVSTRLLIYAGKLITQGMAPRRACQAAVVWAVSDEGDVQSSIEEVVSSIFE